MQKIIQTKELGFISWADKIWEVPPRPLRRILSLMRASRVETILLECRDFTKCKKETCWSHYQHAFDSCRNYVNNLANYNYHLSKKKCYRLCFFDKSFDRLDEIRLLENNNFLGYTIIQQDTFKNSHKKCYITESVVKIPFRTERFAIIGCKKFEQNINNKIFYIKGNYFAQQNGITNTCGYAAIKMALKEDFPLVTSESINALRKGNHHQKIGLKGLTANRICKIIEQLCKLDTFAISSNDLQHHDIMKLIYHAIESRIPVLLLIGTKGLGHAMVIKGHTFNEHSWWSYGLNFYFDGDKNLLFLSSCLWCDNFIIQDDNMGPYYLLPVNFLIGEYFNRPTQNNFFQKLMKKICPKKEMSTNSWIDTPFELIFSYNPQISFFRKQSLVIEPWAISILHEIVKTFLKDSKNIIDKKPFKTYFKSYYENHLLILRTFIINKKDYLAQIKEKTFLNDYLNEDAYKYFPEYFWITEISIPELFWINQKKIGEIITDPYKFEKNKEHGVIFLRILNQIFFKEKDRVVPFKIEPSTRKKWLFKLFITKGNL